MKGAVGVAGRPGGGGEKEKEEKVDASEVSLRGSCSDLDDEGRIELKDVSLVGGLLP